MLQEGDRRFPITLRIDDRYRRDRRASAGILVTVGGGRPRPSREARDDPHRRRARDDPARVGQAAHRGAGERARTRRGTLRGRGEATIEREVALPPGYYVRYGGQFEHLQSGAGRGC
jgi:cobalt-zinc-cadmium resistance protein CzcA